MRTLSPLVFVALICGLAGQCLANDCLEEAIEKLGSPSLLQTHLLEWTPKVEAKVANLAELDLIEIANDPATKFSTIFEPDQLLDLEPLAEECNALFESYLQRLSAITCPGWSEEWASEEAEVKTFRTLDMYADLLPADTLGHLKTCMILIKDAE